MKYVADLHVHSKYSRACSKNLDLEHKREWAVKKGIQILGTGDFTHPAWLIELKNKLIPAEQGLYRLKGLDHKVLFMLTTELSCIYKQGNKVRKIHLCIFVPDFKTVDRIVADLKRRGVNLHADGRPIMGLSAIELTKIVMAANKDSMVIPAHVWTPWFSVFGSKSGFDTLEECFGDQTKHIFAIETGLSSDPAMNHRLSMLDDLTLISNSDAHSPANLGREATVFDIPKQELSFNEIRRILKEKDKARLLYTIEFFPEEGKYHHDGHRECNINFTPEESIQYKNLCPVCKRPLVIGVLNRVVELADREAGFHSNKFTPFKSIVPLAEIISEAVGVGKGSKKVQMIYEEMLVWGTEFEILLDMPLKDLEKFSLPKVTLAIKNMRESKIKFIAGFDGVYGTIKTLLD